MVERHQGEDLIRSLVSYFTQRPFVANMIMAAVILFSVALWDVIGKEEYPEFAMNWVRITVPYPGASAEDVELFVIKPVEEQFKGISGIHEVKSTASFARASFEVTFSPKTSDFTEKLQEVKDSVDRAQLPSETEDPSYRRFSSATKAVVDVALYLEGVELLDVESRRRLQEYALSYKNQILSLPEISGVELRGYLKPEIQIEVDPQKLLDYEIPMAEIASQIQKQHIRTPLGIMEDDAESEVALKSYLNDVGPIQNAIVRSSFQKREVKVSDLAQVKWGFERTNEIRKIQGYEAIVLNLQKSEGTGILKSLDAIHKMTERFLKSHEGSNIRIKLLDDESYSIRNRLSLITVNGLLGFFIILFVLFCFLDFRTGFWVAMGLPFALAFTLISCLLMGYTVNNITLAAVIIVLGIVVDDAIIVADSISRAREKGVDALKASVEGTVRVLQPVLAGVLTTCVAFLPLLFFEGRFGTMIQYIPLVVAAMLVASLIESYTILPAHLLTSYSGKGSTNLFSRVRKIYIPRLEAVYRKLVGWSLHHRWFSIGGFAAFLLLAGWVYQSQLKYVMFPREESKEFAIKVIAPEGTLRRQTAQLVTQVESLLREDKFAVLVGFRTVIGVSRRGGQVRENEASLRVEILPADERKQSLKQIVSYYEQETKKLKGFEEIRFLKNWFGSDGGSPIVVEVLENNDQLRKKASERLKKELESLPALKNVEIEKPLEKMVYNLNLDKSETMRLGIDPEQLAKTMRAYIQGQILYRLYEEEEIDVRLTTHQMSKEKLSQVLGLRATNSLGYLVPIDQLVKVNRERKPTNIERVGFKRVNQVHGDLVEKAKMTPLEVGEYLENNVFPKIQKNSPTTLFRFDGEIEDSRESGSDFFVAILMTIGLVYLILTFMFGSLTTPMIICSSIPFGVGGVMLAFWGHGAENYGFFAVIGAIGMLGVVINDSIVMLNCFETEIKSWLDRSDLLRQIQEIAVTRLRPVILTTLTTVAGVFPTAYGIGGYDSMLSDMMLSMGWGLIFGTGITLFFIPIVYSFLVGFRKQNVVEKV